MTPDFAHNLRSMIASWEDLAVPQPAATVLHGDGFIAARFEEEPVLNNAIVLTPAGVDPAAAVYQPGESYALWCQDDDDRVASALAAHGYAHSETTRPMLRTLDDLPPLTLPVVTNPDPARFAELIEVAESLVRDVPGLRAYANESYDSGLVLHRLDDDVCVSMVNTRPSARRQGFATAMLTAALHDARKSGARTATLQAVPAAENLYARNGFRPVGRWQEWTLS